MYQQLRFAESRELAQQVAADIGDGDALSSARLLIAGAIGALGAAGPSPETEAEMERALELARHAGDPEMELRARNALAVIRSESGRDEPEQWQAVARGAAEIGDWSMAVTARINAAMAMLDDRATELAPALEEARRMAIAHGLTEDGGWVDYVTTEAAFVIGSWDEALATGLRVVQLGEANAYLRLTVRTLHVLIPIAAVRGRRDVLERAAAWYRGLEGKFEFPDSPYSRIIRAAQDVELAAHGLWEPYLPDVEPRIASFDDPSGPSWSAALDRVFRGWVEAGELDGPGRALAHMTEALPRFPKVTSLGLGTYQLMRGRLAAARGDAGETVIAGRSALDHFRLSSVPWWMAKAIRLLERVGASDAALREEVAQIERHLGAIAPTA
jgi:hypothetical protein